MTQPGRTSASVAGWLSRVIGAVLLLEQALSHRLGGGSDLTLVAAGIFLLTGREGVAFIRLLIGRDERP